jgi:hypothetical protein
MITLRDAGTCITKLSKAEPTVSSPGFERWPQNSRNGSGLVLSRSPCVGIHRDAIDELLIEPQQPSRERGSAEIMQTGNRRR